jgi:pimeloyl-ACP methyl ester carboxylesterase
MMTGRHSAACLSWLRERIGTVSDLYDLDPQHYFFRRAEGDDKRLCIVFSARGSKPGSFSLFKTMEKAKVNVLHVTPADATWYQTGLHGLGSDLDTAFTALWSFVRDLCARNGFAELVLIGDSMGAYAAMVFAAYVQDLPTRVISFGGETVLKLPGSRSGEAPFPVRYHGDIRAITYHPGVHVTMIFGEYDAVDAFCALSMADRADFTLMSHIWSPHSVTPEIHADMGLTRFINMALQGRYFYPGRGHMAEALRVGDIEPMVHNRAGSAAYIKAATACTRRYPPFRLAWMHMAEYHARAGELKKAKEMLAKAIVGGRPPEDLARIRKFVGQLAG